jgi:hypothetical protein
VEVVRRVQAAGLKRASPDPVKDTRIGEAEFAGGLRDAQPSAIGWRWEAPHGAASTQPALRHAGHSIT